MIARAPSTSALIDMFNKNRRIKLLCGLIDDLALLARFKDSIKEAHAAFQDFADAFQLETDYFLKEANDEIRGLTPEQWEKLLPAYRGHLTTRLSALWQKHASAPLLSAKLAKLKSNDPRQNKKLKLIEQIELLRKDSPIRKKQIDEAMRNNAQVFLDFANQVFPDWERFEAAVKTRPLGNLEDIVRRILGKSRSAARQCDDLMRCAEQANSVISQTLQDMFPEAAVRVEAELPTVGSSRKRRRLEESHHG